MHYIIDGYNMIFANSDEELLLGMRRDALISLLREAIPSIKGSVTVVFDAYLCDGEDKRIHSGDLEVIYTAVGETADDHITTIVSASENPRVCTVVTDDKGLVMKVHSFGGRSIGIKAFLKRLLTTKRSGVEGLVKPSSNLNGPEKARWLRLFEEGDKEIKGDPFGA